jgi:Domain of unknown function (DUF4376)
MFIGRPNIEEVAMTIDPTLVSLAANMQSAASKLAAVTASSTSRQFYASSDGWVCFGIPGQVSATPFNTSRLYLSLTAAIDAAAMNATLQTSVAAKDAADLATAQAAYETAVATLTVTDAGATLAAQLPQPTQPNQATPTIAQLIAYANAAQNVVLNGGVTVNGVEVGTDAAGRGFLAGAYSLATAQPSMTFNWVTDTGAVSLTATQVQAMAVIVGIWVQALFTALGSMIADINSSTITAYAQIDAATWPSKTLTA